MSDAIVVDASLVAKWFLAESDTTQAVALLNTRAAAGARLLAPSLLASELCNILHRRVLRGMLPFEDAKVALQTAIGGIVTLDGDMAISVQALELARRLSLPAAYDARYLAVAEREQCALWTADERLYNAVKTQLPWVHWIGQQTPARTDPADSADS